MKIKTIFGILLTIILLLLVGSILYDNFSTQHTVKVCDANFLLPEGYKDDGINKFGALTITNGKNPIYILGHDDSNINKYVGEYERVVKNKNETMTIENTTINNTIVYKTNNINNSDVTHVWFVKNGDTYEIYKYDNNPEFDSLVSYLINHMT